MDNNSNELVDILIGDPHFVNTVLNAESEVGALVEEYLQVYPESSEAIHLAIWILRSQKVDLSDEVEEDFHRMWGELSRNSSFGRVSVKRRMMLHSAAARWLTAACIVLMSLVGIWFWSGFFPSHSETSLGHSTVTKYNPSGQKSIISLPDGSKVTLNSESSISYMFPFDASERLVNLEGEAFFNVVKDPERPFVVASGGISTTALGTSFNVKYYPNDLHCAVSLVTGKVVVKSTEKGSQIVLLPGEQIVASRKDLEFRKQNFNYKEVALWKERVIYFDQAGWQNILRTLERWYGVKIHASVPPKTIEYSGQFEDLSLESTLTSMGYTLGFSFTIEKDKHVIITFK